MNNIEELRLEILLDTLNLDEGSRMLIMDFCEKTANAAYLDGQKDGSEHK